MENSNFTNGNLKIEKEWLTFPSGEIIKLSQITNMNVDWFPKKSIIMTIVIWIVSFYIYSKVDGFFNIDSLLWDLFGLGILFGGGFVLKDNIKYNLHEARKALRIQLSSGYIIFIHSKDYKFLNDLKKTLRDASLTKSDIFNINLNNHGIVNIGENINNN